MTSRSETPESPAYAAWRAECAKIDLRREGAAKVYAMLSSMHPPVSGKWAEELFPYPPEPPKEEPREVEVGRGRYRRLPDGVWQYRVGSDKRRSWCNNYENDEYVYALASLLPKADRIRLAEEGE